MPSEPIPAWAPGPRPSAPGALESVRQFLNTYDVETGGDLLTDVGELRRWLVSHDLLRARERLGPGDLERARTVREALRGLLLERAQGPVSAATLRTLNAAAGSAPVTVMLDGDGATSLTPAARGLDSALARIFAIIERASAEGTWQRLKVCGAQSCQAAFYDRSRNCSGTWCSMAVCGNRHKARTFRHRQRAT